MSNRRYYSVRTGKNDAGKLDLEKLKEMFIAIYYEFSVQKYFVEFEGYKCTEVGRVYGTAGPNISNFITRKIRKNDLWPLLASKDYSEDDLFDIIELMYDYISKPIAWTEHVDCGRHYRQFDKKAAQGEFRVVVNEILQDYSVGYQLSGAGEIVSLAEPGMIYLLEDYLPEYDSENVESRVDSAIQKFRSRHSSIADRREAVRTLADVLEFLRPKLKGVITKKDEGDLFNIANNFGIRHHDGRQQVDYDPEIWLNWMFYFYLSTIHTAVKIIKKKEGQD